MNFLILKADKDYWATTSTYTPILKSYSTITKQTFWPASDPNDIEGATRARVQLDWGACLTWGKEKSFFTLIKGSIFTKKMLSHSNQGTNLLDTLHGSIAPDFDDNIESH